MQHPCTHFCKDPDALIRLELFTDGRRSGAGVAGGTCAGRVEAANCEKTVPQGCNHGLPSFFAPLPRLEQKHFNRSEVPLGCVGRNRCRELRLPLRDLARPRENSEAQGGSNSCKLWLGASGLGCKGVKWFGIVMCWVDLVRLLQLCL